MQNSTSGRLFCATQTCSGRGVCSENPGGFESDYSCACEEGYFGIACQYRSCAPTSAVAQIHITVNPVNDIPEAYWTKIEAFQKTGAMSNFENSLKSMGK